MGFREYDDGVGGRSFLAYEKVLGLYVVGEIFFGAFYRDA